MAAEPNIETSMIHLVCDACGMSATLVVTATARIAWEHHMLTHGLEATYKQYTWTAVRLFDPFDELPRRT